MLQQGKELKDMTVVELKALAYDLIVQREQNLQELQIVNQAIAQDQQNAGFRTPDVVPPVEKE